MNKKICNVLQVARNPFCDSQSGGKFFEIGVVFVIAYHGNEPTSFFGGPELVQQFESLWQEFDVCDFSSFYSRSDNKSPCAFLNDVFLFQGR